MYNGGRNSMICTPPFLDSLTLLRVQGVKICLSEMKYVPILLEEVLYSVVVSRLSL